jgi:phage baseplate assembly protein gpV
MENIKRIISFFIALLITVQLLLDYQFISGFSIVETMVEPISDEATSFAEFEIISDEDNNTVFSNIIEYEDWVISSNEQLTGKRDVNNLIINSGTLDLNEHLLIVHGNITFNNGTININKGQLVCENLTMQNGTLNMGNINDSITINGNLNQNGGTINLNNGLLNCGGDVRIASWLNLNRGTFNCEGNFELVFRNGYITMQFPEDVLNVRGNFIFNGGWNTSTFTNGKLFIGGNCTINSGFSASGNHETIFDGVQKQVIRLADANQRFSRVVFRNSSPAGVEITNMLNANSSIIEDGCITTFVIGGSPGFVLTENKIINEDFIFAVGMLDLNGFELTINGDLIQSGGEVFINGGTLNINGNYRIESRRGTPGNYIYGHSDGWLIMTSPNDRVNVSGNFITASIHDHRNRLTAGTLTISGDFQQRQHANSFSASGSHTVVFEGDKSHTINFASANGNSQSYFANLDLGNETIIICMGRWFNFAGKERRTPVFPL